MGAQVAMVGVFVGDVGGKLGAEVVDWQNATDYCGDARGSYAGKKRRQDGEGERRGTRAER